MQLLNTFLSIVSTTTGRDKFLRIVQYATLHSTQQPYQIPSSINPALNVYIQIRNTRKVLRFLRTLQYSTKIRKQVPQLIQSIKNFKLPLLKHLFSILQNVCTFFFYLSDHRVLLSELGVIDKSYHNPHYIKSYKFYLFENIFGILKNIIQIIIMIFQGKYEQQHLDFKTMNVLIKRKMFDAFRCLLDIVVALHYLTKSYGNQKGLISARAAGACGVITSVMAIMQILVII